ncbi:MAG: hypothetical protein GWO38_17880, partial [Phycisphaerae bacterium]|nr:hypothetical protein [Phycisphaerae bacterium]NIP54132.1 hypothetical protein [Phycisphaerae bacterium]NIX00503.1 hypothetical protein [Phycisphaerae bacterium]NIX29446.1 hypothetical protein [Phycisphaerae bacterium]
MTETSGHKDKKNITRLKAENHRLRDELAAARKEIDFRGALVQEAYHRTKNHLSVLLSTLNLQVRSHSGTEVEGALLDARSRVMAVLSLNDRFSRANDKSSMDAGPYIKGLVRAVFDMLAEKKSDIEL